MFALITDVIFSLMMLTIVCVVAWVAWSHRQQVNRRKRLCLATGVAAGYVMCLEFVTKFIIFGRMLGGTPLNGKTERGRYYFGNHGIYTEVSESTYVTGYGVWYGLEAAFALLVLATIAQLWILVRRGEVRRPAEGSTDQTPDRPARWGLW
jgi:hypothetical protein